MEGLAGVSFVLNRFNRVVDRVSIVFRNVFVPCELVNLVWILSPSM